MQIVLAKAGNTRKVYIKKWAIIPLYFLFTHVQCTRTHTHKNTPLESHYLMDHREKTIINADSFSWHTKHDDHRTIQQRGNSLTRLRANVDSLCTSETRVTVSQKLSWLTHSNPQRKERARQQGIQGGGGSLVQAVYNDEGQIRSNVNKMQICLVQHSLSNLRQKILVKAKLCN